MNKIAAEYETLAGRPAPKVDLLNEEWPRFAHPKRPEFLLTRPDRDRTSGFFIARMKRPHRPSQHRR